jgi:DNA-binding NtrC family response regulator
MTEETAKKISEPNGITILVGDDDRHLRYILDFHLKKEGYTVVQAENGNEVIDKVSDNVSVVLLDLEMPGMHGFDCLKVLQKRYPDIQVIIVTGSKEISDAVKAMRLGAFDYVTKPVNIEALTALIEKALQTARLSEENKQLRSAIGHSRPQTELIGQSQEMKQLIEKVDKIAPLDSTVLLTGESGSGKSLLARIIHYHSPRADKPFVTVSCTSLPRELVESEMFGHEKGAFTGAVDKRLGRVELAEGGTLFLDEIGDLPLELQPKLLTFLQERYFHRIGGNKPIEVDVRVIAATHQNLQQLCKEGKFRQDLFFRLNVIPLEATALRERREDIPVLANHLLGQISQRRKCKPFQLGEQASEALRNYAWPGNVRELENVLERTTAFCEGPRIELEDLPPEIGDNQQAPGGASLDLGRMSFSEIEKLAIMQTLNYCGENRARAAQSLGISEKSIYNKIKKYGLS